MSDLVKVRSLSVFEGSEEKRWIGVGDVWEVSPSRAAELEANGLVERQDRVEEAEVPTPPSSETPEPPPPAPPAEVEGRPPSRAGRAPRN